VLTGGRRLAFDMALYLRYPIHMKCANIQQAILAGALLAGAVAPRAETLEPSDYLLMPPAITSFVMWQGGTVGDEWFRPPSDVDVRFATSGADKTAIRIPELTVPRGVTLRLSSGANTIRLEVAGHTVIRGLIDARDQDLVIDTQEFRLESGGGFLADNYQFVATDVVLEEEFNPVVGGDYSLAPTNSGSVFAGSGVISVDAKVPAQIFQPTTPPTVPQTQLVPVPASLALWVPALVMLMPWKRVDSRFSPEVARP